MAITLGLVKGLMFGIEYDEMDDGVFYVVLDLGIFRFCYYKAPPDYQEEE